jgi:sugar phosphate isomerase/epimerase
MNTISFNAANFVAREIGYNMPGGWGEGASAAAEWFRPVSTFAERFDDMLGEVTDLGFNAIDIWSEQLHFSWATTAHIQSAKSLLDRRGLIVTSYGGGAGTVPDLRLLCSLCANLDIPVIGGGTSLLDTDRQATVETLREFGIALGYENHPEKSAVEILAKIGKGDNDVIGAAVDTGWFGTQNFDGPLALRELAPRLKLIHLKDVKARRATPSGYPMIDMGHETCRYGEGIVNIKACVDTLKEIGYAGAISIEHEPEDFDPREDVKASKVLLEQWLS